ncbi:MAG: polyphosphate polymerase domain-containing protein [Eubacteriales bacterium]
MNNQIVQVERSENKYYLRYDLVSELKKELQKILELDEYSSKGSYIVRSLYFDTINNNDFNEKMAGVQNRKKIRLRVYSPNSKNAKFEIKAKQGAFQKKSSLIVSREVAEQIMQGNYGILLNHSENLIALKLYSMLTLGCYRPVVLIEYDRIAYTYPENDIRITIDTKVRSSEIELDLFNTEVPFIGTIQEQAIVEVKFNGKLLESLAKIFSKYPMVQTSISKYGTGRPIMQKYI